MAEPFGIAAGAIGIAAAFTACVDCFSYVQLGRHFGRDFQTGLLSLDCARLRLTRWGKAVDIYEDPKLGRPDATSAELQIAEETLVQILLLFENSQKIAEKYKASQIGASPTSASPTKTRFFGRPTRASPPRTSEPKADLTILTLDELNPTIRTLHNKMRLLATRRQKGTSIIKVVQWALYHRSELSDLIQNITALIDNIENLFPARQSQLMLVKQETAEIDNKQSLGMIESAAQDVDTLLQAAAKECLTGHQFLNVMVRGKGQLGDVFTGDWKGGACGAGHKYDGAEVATSGRALFGTQYGGKSFWDD